VNYNPTNNDDDDDESPVRKFFIPQKKRYQQYDHAFTSEHIHFYLSEEIGRPDEYTDMIHRINTAAECDSIFIHLNTHGGRLDTGVQIINAMQNSAARIVTIIEAEAYSLGTLIFLAGDELIVNDHCMIMFHNFKGAVVGKGHEQLAQLEATVTWFTELAREIYVPFLTEDEFERIIKGEDLYMHSIEIRERVARMIKTIEDQIEEAAKQAAIAQDIEANESTRKTSRRKLKQVVQ